MLISVAQAAKLLNLKSRGGIYRKIRDLELKTVEGPDGSQMLEREGLEERWAAITRTRSDSPQPLRPAAERMKPKPKPEVRVDGISPPDDASEVPDYSVERALHEREKRIIASLERQKLERLLLRREDVEAAWNQAVNITRNRLRGVPSGVKQRIPHLEPEEVEVITQLIDEALNELASGEVTA